MIYPSVKRETTSFCLLSRFRRPPRQFAGDRDCGMMYTLKGRYAAVTLLLFSFNHGNLFVHTQQQRERNPMVSPRSPWYFMPLWDYISSEIILKALVPSREGANARHKRLLDVSVYGGPVDERPEDHITAVLSRGSIYHLFNDHWMLCQDGCLDCEPCMTQSSPLFRWILRRVKRLPDSDPPRHDLQLMLIPQTYNHFYTRNLWPNYYIYVMIREELAPFLSTSEYDRQNSLSGHENDFSDQHHGSKNLWRLKGGNSIVSRDEMSLDDNPVSSSTGRIEKEEFQEGQKRGFENVGRRGLQPRLAEKPVTDVPIIRRFTDITANEKENADRLLPKLILGTDQRGHKHLVHVVPADPPTTAFPSYIIQNYPNSSSLTASPALHLNKTTTNHEKQTYQWIFRKIFDSLSTHRRTIEDFLESPVSIDRHHPSSSTDNKEAARFFWYDRGARDAANTDFALMHNDGTQSLPLYTWNDNNENYQQSNSRHDRVDIKQDVKNYHSGYQDMYRANILPKQTLTASDPSEEWQKIYTKPYFVNDIRKDTPKRNLLNSSGRLENSSVDVSLKFNINNGSSAQNIMRQTDRNNLSIDKAIVLENSSTESNSASVELQDEQLYPRRLLNDDAEQRFKASRHSFKVIVTTELSEKQHKNFDKTQ